MEYNQLVQSLNQLDFVDNPEVADAAIKATFGIMVSRMEEEDAKTFTNLLPEPLTFEKLRSHQAKKLKINRDEFIQEIGAQFKLNSDEAENLVKTVIKTAKENLSNDQVKTWEEKLPKEWKPLVKES